MNHPTTESDTDDTRVLFHAHGIPGSPAVIGRVLQMAGETALVETEWGSRIQVPVLALFTVLEPRMLDCAISREGGSA